MAAPILRAPLDLIDPDERIAAGRALRDRLRRGQHSDWRPDNDRADPIAILKRSDRGRLRRLVPIRYGRMIESPFAFLRGAAEIMAADLARTPTTGLKVQLCGDAHLANFGGYATPERNLVFDVNDFDETLPGPWEWDVKRLAASVVVASRAYGASEADARDAALAAVRSYRTQMREFGAMRFLDLWYEAIYAKDAIERLRWPSEVMDELEKARSKRTNLGALPRLTEAIEGGLRIADDPPLVTHHTQGIVSGIETILRRYRNSLSSERRILLDRYRIVDIARKVVGVGSVGLRCYVMLMLGSHGEDPLFLQLKEAQPSALAPYLPKTRYMHEGKRVADGQRIMQAASDLFLGWTKLGSTRFYVRQLRDAKFAVPLDLLDAEERSDYAEVCGWALARAHACSGDAAQIAGYLGPGDGFDRAVASFAVSYADQTEADHAALERAVRMGKVPVERGV